MQMVASQSQVHVSPCARRDGWTVAHVHISFAEDYSDLPRNSRLFLAVEERGALRLGSWGAAALAGFEPAKGEVTDPVTSQAVELLWVKGSGRTSKSRQVRLPRS